MFYSCPICLEKIIRPKSLPCLHTFCEKCLQTYISRASLGKDPEKFDFECPVCRRVTGQPDEAIAVDQWAKHFPTNILVNSLTNLGDEKNEDKCCAICLRDNKKCKAESWCNDCAEAICTSCKRLHQIVGSLQKHKISALHFDDKDDKPKFPELDEPCHLHQGRYVEVFCLDHEALCCSVCFATQHRHCEHVEALDDVSKNISKLAIKGNIDVLSKISKIIEESIELREKEIVCKSAKREEIMNNVSLEISNIKLKLDKLQQQFEKDLLKKHEDIEEKLKQCVLDLKQYLLTVKNGMTLLSAAQESGSSKQVFLSAVKTARDAEEQLKHYKTRNAEDEVYDYEHDHTTILKQICERNKIDDVLLLTRPSGTL
ncbi:E3 ubiquitin-protein ligase TRIM56-like [Saccostrea echinata]|uniref:E3 ubiquitin-protein ligase TRIM56-like n=1 Tax=Saccostrea echinata TaxID=191078 RepID=UPI002A83037B|nr:E3 ubiquitin-protein ligase TRIM56-like [Saccostrea echinata]